MENNDTTVMHSLEVDEEVYTDANDKVFAEDWEEQDEQNATDIGDETENPAEQDNETEIDTAPDSAEEEADDTVPAEIDTDTSPDEGEQEQATTEDFDIEQFFDSDWVDPAIVDGVKAVFGKLAADNKALKEKVSRIDNVFEVQAQREYVENFESRLRNLGEDYDDIFASSKRGTELPSDSEELKNRIKLDEHIHILRSGYEKSGKQSPADDELFSMAVNSLFTDVKSSGRKRSRPSLLRPSKSSNREESDFDKALKKSHKLIDEIQEMSG